MQQFTGTYTALVTPFRDDKVDASAFARLIDQQIAGGVDGVVAVGTTGESPTLDHDEHVEVIRLAVEAAGKRCKVIAGTGSNCTAGGRGDDRRGRAGRRGRGPARRPLL